MPTKTECNKHLCDSKIYSESELRKGLLAMKKLIISEGIVNFEADERFKMLTQCKTNVDEVYDENQCANLNKPKPAYRRPQQSRRKTKDPNAEAEKRQKKQEEKKAKKDQKAFEKEREKKRKADEKEREKERKADEKEKEKERKAHEKDQEKKQKAFEKEQQEHEKKKNKTEKATKRCPNGTRRNKKTGECEKKKESTPPQKKKSQSPPPQKKDSPRISKKVKTYPISFLFTVIGGKKVDEVDDDWKSFPANQLSKEAKETFKLGVINQLHLYDGIRADELSYEFTKEGVVVKTNVGFNIRTKSEESDQMIEYIEFVNNKTIWQTFFKTGELDVESDGNFYAFEEVIIMN